MKMIDSLKGLIVQLIYFVRKRDDNFNNPFVIM